MTRSLFAGWELTLLAVETRELPRESLVQVFENRSSSECPRMLRAFRFPVVSNEAASKIEGVESSGEESGGRNGMLEVARQPMLEAIGCGPEGRGEGNQVHRRRANRLPYQ